jgi:hypothetical protein
MSHVGASLSEASQHAPPHLFEVGGDAWQSKARQAIVCHPITDMAGKSPDRLRLRI